MELTFEFGGRGGRRRWVLKRIFMSGDVEDNGVTKGSCKLSSDLHSRCEANIRKLNFIHRTDWLQLAVDEKHSGVNATSQSARIRHRLRSIIEQISTRAV